MWWHQLADRYAAVLQWALLAQQYTSRSTLTVAVMHANQKFQLRHPPLLCHCLLLAAAKLTLLTPAMDVTHIVHTHVGMGMGQQADQLIA